MHDHDLQPRINALVKTCDAPDCTRPPRSPGSKWCHTHYGRLRKYGSLDLSERLLINGGLCAVENCQWQAKTQGYCGLHWERIRRHGDPMTEVLIWGDEERRWWSKVTKTGTCWLWTGHCNRDGYGEFKVGDKGWLAHRYGYEMLVGPIPEALHLDHVHARGCRHRNCVNPDHLEPVTTQENTRRALEARR